MGFKFPKRIGMKKEISAGGIIVRNQGKAWEVLLIKDMNGKWTFPKGLIEPGEPISKTAVREISEEVGLTDINIMKELQPIHYYYRREKNLVYKTVHYFLFRTEGKETPEPQTEEGISETIWKPIPEAISIIGYPETNRPLLENVLSILDNSGIQTA